MIHSKTEIYYLHYQSGWESVYYKVHSGQKRVTVVSISGKKGRAGKYCVGVYEIQYITLIAMFGGYDKYWPGGAYAKWKNIHGEIIGHKLKFTTANQYEKAKAQILNSLI